jgi:transcriptional regulator with XRE-family HTH domain
VARQPEHLTEQQRKLGRYLAARREAAGLYQADIARAVPCHRTTVTHAEAGSQLPDVDFWEIADRVVGADGALIARYDELIQAKAAHLAEQQAKRRARAQATVQQLTKAPPPRLEQARREGLSNQTLIGTAIDQTPDDAIPAAARQSSAARLISLDGWNVLSDPLSIATIRAISESFQVADRKLGGGLLYHSVARYIKLEISPSLLDPPRDCSSSELFSAAASLTEMAGWMAHDGGSDDKSQRHFSQAYHLAVAAENPVLSANVCASMSHLAVQRGQAEDAARISAAGLARATQGEGTEQLVARLYAMRARAAAMQSRAKECHLALDSASDTLRNCAGSTRAEWIAGFDEASLAGESALCFYSLGTLDEAENEARKVIELRRTGDRARSRAFGQLTLANVFFKAGAVDEAARVGSETCLVARSLSSARVRSGLSRLGESLGASRAVPDVALFLNHLTQLTEKSIAGSHDQTRWPL